MKQKNALGSVTLISNERYKPQPIHKRDVPPMPTGFMWRENHGRGIEQHGKCPFCGRRWIGENPGHTGWTGFLVSSISTHVYNCQQRTPAERVKANIRDEKRWAKHPLQHTEVWNNPAHEGLK